MVKLIDGLEARGFVERVRNPDDRRAYALHPTRAGLESLTEMLPRMARAEPSSPRRCRRPSTRGSTSCCAR